MLQQNANRTISLSFKWSSSRKLTAINTESQLFFVDGKGLHAWVLLAPLNLEIALPLGQPRKLSCRMFAVPLSLLDWFFINVSMGPRSPPLKEFIDSQPTLNQLGGNTYEFKRKDMSDRPWLGSCVTYQASDLEQLGSHSDPSLSASPTDRHNDLSTPLGSCEDQSSRAQEVSPMVIHSHPISYCPVCSLGLSFLWFSQ